MKSMAREGFTGGPLGILINPPKEVGSVEICTVHFVPRWRGRIQRLCCLIRATRRSRAPPAAFSGNCQISAVIKGIFPQSKEESAHPPLPPPSTGKVVFWIPLRAGMPMANVGILLEYTDSFSYSKSISLVAVFHKLTSCSSVLMVAVCSVLLVNPHFLYSQRRTKKASDIL